MRIIITFILGLFIQQTQAQSFVNGDFEKNTAHSDQINLPHEALNIMLPGVTSFGSYGDVDIIKSIDYGGSGAQNKIWYIALTGGKTDIVALELTAPLVKGKKYSIFYYDRKTNGYIATPLQIGLSDKNNDFGTEIYSGTENPQLNTWQQRIFTFIAPFSGKYITVQMPQGTLSDWVNIDNFSFTDENAKKIERNCATALTISNSTIVIERGTPVTFTVYGGVDYTWSNTKNAITQLGNIATFAPDETIIYTAWSKQAGCPDVSASVLVNVREINTVSKYDTIDVTEIDSIAYETHRFVKFNKHRLNRRKYQVQQSMLVESDLINVQVYDKNRVDGDIVSIYLNGELLVENLQVTKEKKEIKLRLQQGSNILVMYTINLGRIPPNTAAIAINNTGNKYKTTTLVSDFKKSGALELLYYPDGLSLK